jgi:GH15 family glucan-1,4-alpha-glucosidase
MNKISNTYNMGVVGNCSYLAYIDDKADVKWMCMPRFDSSFLFGSLLDNEKGGEFSIKPAEENYMTSQYYIKNTNVLVTEFSNDSWRFRVIDFAPRFYQFDRYFKPLMFIRKIELVSGNPFISVRCKPVGNYGKLIPEMVQGSNHIRYLNLDNHVRLTTDVPLNYIMLEKPFVLSETKYLVLTYGAPLEASLSATAERFLENTTNYWKNWIKGTSIPNLFQSELIRSALVLKLHQYEDTGGIIAAGTTSLPEYQNSGRNWDYRYCWMRDTYYTLNAFNNIGHFEELEQYFNFIQNIILNENNSLKPLYTITGDKVDPVKYLDLKGYHGNQPVRIGNDAINQVQNDVYGQVLVSLLPLFVDKRLDFYDKQKIEQITWYLLNGIRQVINIPDNGIWEFENTIQHHCYTHLFHWAGCNAAYKIGKHLNDHKMVSFASELKRESIQKIEQCYNMPKKAYAQAIGSTHLDASGLKLITMNYLPPDDPKTIAHLKAHEKELKNSDGSFYRYMHADDHGKPEVSFMICSFWYAEALVCMGKLDESFQLLNKLSSYSNHLGLLSEDTDSKCGQWGNFPQTYSHVGLINAVYRLANKLDNPIFL